MISSDLKFSVIKSVIVRGNCSAASHCTFLTCAIFQILFVNGCLKSFLFEILDFLCPELSINNHFTMAKDGTCGCFHHRCFLNQVKSPFFVFLSNSNHLKTLLQKDAVLSNFPSISCLKLEKKLSIKGIPKDKHLIFARIYGNLNKKKYFHRQLFAKCIWNFIGFKENLHYR